MNDPSNLIIPSLISLGISVMTALGTAFITSILYWRKAKIDLHKEYESRYNTKRWETYLGMNEIIQEIYSRKQSVDDDAISLENKIGSLRNQILLIGSYNVVNAFAMWQKQRAVQSDSHPDTFAKLHILVIAMRKDLGIQDNLLELEVTQGLFPRYRR